MERDNIVVKRTLLSLLLGLFILLAILWYVKPQNAIPIILEADIRLVSMGLALLILDLILRGVRWKLILKPIRECDLKSLSSILAIGYFLNMMIPFRVGEAMSIILLRKYHSVKIMEGAASVLLARVLDLFSILSLGLLSYVLAMSHVKELLAETFTKSIVFLEMLALGSLLVIIALRKRFEKVGEEVLDGPLDGKRGVLFQLSQSLRLFIRGLRIVKERHLLLSCWAISLLIWINTSILYACFMYAFHINLPLIIITFGVVAVALLSIVPLTPLQIGVFEAIWAFTFVNLGLDPQVALIIAISIHVLCLSLLAVEAIVGSLLLNLKLGREVGKWVLELRK